MRAARPPLERAGRRVVSCRRYQPSPRAAGGAPRRRALGSVRRPAARPFDPRRGQPDDEQKLAFAAIIGLIAAGTGAVVSGLSILKQRCPRVGSRRGAIIRGQCRSISFSARRASRTSPSRRPSSRSCRQGHVGWAVVGAGARRRPLGLSYAEYHCYWTGAPNSAAGSAAVRRRPRRAADPGASARVPSRLARRGSHARQHLHVYARRADGRPGPPIPYPEGHAGRPWRRWSLGGVLLEARISVSFLHGQTKGLCLVARAADCARTSTPGFTVPRAGRLALRAVQEFSLHQKAGVLCAGRGGGGGGRYKTGTRCSAFARSGKIVGPNERGACV